MPGIEVPEIDDNDEDLLVFPMVTVKRKREDEEDEEYFGRKRLRVD